MTINELLAAAGLNGTDELPIWNGATQKVTAQQLADAVKTLANLQGELTFDNAPTAGSTNPVTSDGINTAIEQSTATVDLTKPITGILDSDNGGLGTNINGAIKLIRPTLANDLDNFFTEQPNVSIRLIPSGVYNGNVVGPAGETGNATWFVISYKYSATIGSQWGFYPSGAYKGIYVRSNNNGWGAWSKLV